MTELTSNSVMRLAYDVDGISSDLRELKGSVEGLKHAHQILIGAVGVVAAALFGAVIYLGTEVSGFSTRVDGLVAGLSEVRGRLEAIDQRLTVLEEIRDRIDQLALAAPNGEQIAPSEESSMPVARDVPDGALPSGGVILVGDIDPTNLEHALQSLEGEVKRMVGSDAIEAKSLVFYSSVGNAVDWAAAAMEAARGAPGFKTAATLDEFKALVGEYNTTHPEGGVLFVSTNDAELRAVANQHGVKFNR